MTPYSADTGTTLWYHTGSYDINFKYSFSKKWWSHLRRSCSRLQDFSCRRDHDADADAIMKFFTWSKTEKLREWPHDRTQFPADGITTPRLLYIRSLVHDVIKIEVHDRVWVCAPSAGNIDNPYVKVKITPGWYFSCRPHSFPVLIFHQYLIPFSKTRSIFRYVILLRCYCE